MKTELLSAHSPNEQRTAIRRAVALLQAGEVVALPTETVYGLGADALSADAVIRIFESKKRPRFDPLIVHLPEEKWLERIAVIPPQSRSLVEQLIERFWPGPLTIVLPATNLTPDIVRAGLETVAVRMSQHPVFSEVIQTLGRPIAAPSANRFGRISPTEAGHVMEELAGRIPLVIDGGRTSHGLESTIVSVRGSRLTILRQGPITAEQLRELAQVSLATADSQQPHAPGQLPSHYAPGTPLQLIQDISAFVVPQGKRYGALLWQSNPSPHLFVETRHMTMTANLREAGANLFRMLRELDQANLDGIVAEKVPEVGLGLAIMDRLRRAAG